LLEDELHDSVLELTTYANIKNNNMALEQNNTLESFQFLNSERLEIGSIVDLLYKSFGKQEDIEVSFGKTRKR
ncbi:12487_t:CDS:1, partial [Dentiscutata erythropus]